MEIVSADFGGRRTRRRIIRWSLLVLGALVLFWLAPVLTNTYTEWLWFKFDARFPRIFWTILSTKLGLGLAFGVAFFVLVLGNVEVARRFARRTVWYEEERLARLRLAEVMEYFASRYLYLALVILAAVAAYGVGVSAADHWNQYLLFRHGVPFPNTDPIFHRNLGFYVFRLPFWRYLWQWTYLVLIAVFLVSAAAHYFDKAIRVLRGIPAFAPHVKTHLSVLLALILGVKAISYRIDSWMLLYSERGATFGASYTDVHAQLLAYTVLFFIALAAAAIVLVNIHFRGLWLPIAAIGFLAVSSLLLNVVYPAIIQRVQVEPNEFDREKTYIAYSIKFTREGYGLDRIDEQDMEDIEPLSARTVRENIASVENVRLWDYRPLLDTYQSQQALWFYYKFNAIDIDRYRIDGRYRQVMLAARELDLDSLFSGQGGQTQVERTWQNEHVFYTHGCGVVMSPVSDVIGSGLPNYVIKDIPPQSTFNLKVTQPRIYYGELTNNYVIVQTRENENDYPRKADEPAKTRYSGAGGVPIGSSLPRLATAARFRDVNIIISNIITKKSRILWGRNIDWRARHIAPFLAYDRDPYIVVGDDGRLYWIQDAYTTSAMYPYSEPYESASGSFNYVRNSVKVVTDAYDGTVTFYTADPEDPILKAYSRIFPGVFHPLEEMPAGLLSHIRYPEALFNTQTARLTIYHMTDPRAFYNRIEKWEIARESPKSVGPSGRRLVGGGSDTQGETMQAYYAVMVLPGQAQPEFLLMLPFTPQDRKNMVAWLAARCDGNEYGKLLLYNFPKTRQIWGPIQIEASIDQDESISEWITLRNQQGSAVVRGNLLVIPLGRSILYVEPIYLRAAQSPIPELKQVVVARSEGNNVTVAMQPTLWAALTAVLGQSVAAPASQQSAAGAHGGPPQATTMPPPSGVSPEVRALVARANEQFQQALENQRKGDWAAYGQSLAKLRQTLSELDQKTRQ